MSAPVSYPRPDDKHPEFFAAHRAVCRACREAYACADRVVRDINAVREDETLKGRERADLLDDLHADYIRAMERLETCRFRRWIGRVNLYLQELAPDARLRAQHQPHAALWVRYQRGDDAPEVAEAIVEAEAA